MIAFAFKQKKTHVFHISAFLLLCFFVVLFSSFRSFVLELNEIKSANIELRRRKWCIYDCEYKNVFTMLGSMNDERWRFISAKKNREKKEKKVNVWREKERKTLKQLLIAHRYFTLLCFAIIVPKFIENKNTGH